MGLNSIRDLFKYWRLAGTFMTQFCWKGLDTKACHRLSPIPLHHTLIHSVHHCRSSCLLIIPSADSALCQGTGILFSSSFTHSYIFGRKLSFVCLWSFDRKKNSSDLCLESFTTVISHYFSIVVFYLCFLHSQLSWYCWCFIPIPFFPCGWDSAGCSRNQSISLSRFHLRFVLLDPSFVHNKKPQIVKIVGHRWTAKITSIWLGPIVVRRPGKFF